MSESIARKVQPFTIGTRLSVPAVPKCQDFTQSFLQTQTLDNCSHQHNLNERVTLYLSRSQVCADGPLLSPLAKQGTPVRRQQEDMAAEDHLNRNAVSPNAVSRSIRKITISGNKEDGENKASVGQFRPVMTVSPKAENINNNNNITTSYSQLPRIVGVSCENKPSSQLKVVLRKDSIEEQKANTVQGHCSAVQWNTEKIGQQTLGTRARSPKKDQLRRESPPYMHKDASTVADSQSDCFAHRNSLFNREVLQAEAWIKGKLQELKDGWKIQRCPLQDWQEVSQTLQRDLKDFENTLIQLNQMGEQLICRLNPTSDLVRKQLSQLRDQWLTLKQTAANQSRALGGARNLQEFNKKVDKLEAWIKAKEEEQSLVNLLGQNIDKMQLTRWILDLKQDEQLYRNLHEEINHLALQLEKQGKTEGRNISTRRKHANKMWLKVQSNLKDYHENLQLALEVSSFYQQANNILFASNSMMKSISRSNDQETNGDREIRDLASQIMMLDVTVSQLSNLHPALAARVTHKQSEVKDGWALLQKAVRSDRVPLPPAGSTFTREDADPPTPALQCAVGMEAHRIMGKDVKEEQNRLKGCVSVGDCVTVNYRKTQRSPGKDQPSASHTSSPLGDGPACLGDVIARRQSEAESRKQRAEPRSAAGLRGHPHLTTQLHKFTVSADKTLSWLKDNVAMATQVCSMAGVEGLEAARRCQDALEQEILTNRARIEVVKKEGRGLVRAQHPGSAKIEEFLGQLEVLWEELKRRHQRNAVYLRASEELGFRAVKVLQALGSLEAWLESVELSMRESSLAGDPETMSVAERESCLLEREVAARGLELNTLRLEVERLSRQRHPHTEPLPARMGEVENKYRRVQSALTQQSSELQDTRMLTEFLERVELEESQEVRGSHYSSLEQPLHRESSPTPALLGLQGGGGGVPLMESMGDPVEELREAVEMLNDTVRERGRSQSHDQAIQELLSRHASLAVRIEERLSCSRALGVGILGRETDMVVKCEPDRCGLEGLQEQQDHMEIDYKVIKVEVEEMERQGSRLEELCPERVHVLGTEVQATLQAWVELGKSVLENRGRLHQFVQLQDFFRSYLGMISWTEDTRSCIFSDSTLHLGKEGQEPMAAELDLQIDQKFEEFEELSAAGRELLEAEHHLAEMIQERMEELRNMLGWILVHWRAQKQQWSLRRKREVEDAAGDNIYSEATVCSTLRENVPSEPECSPPVVSVCEDRQRAAAGPRRPSARTSRLVDQQAEGELEDGYEVMNSIGPRGADVTPLESSTSPFLVLKDPSSPALGSTVNLILSFANSEDGHVRVQESPARMEEVEEENSEPLHRVSTYLHVKDNHMAPVYESITLPRLHGKTRLATSNIASSSSSSPSSSSASSSTCPVAQVSSVSFHALTRGGSGSSSTSILSSLKRISKKRKRKRDARRHTIQRIMGGEQAEGVSPPGAEPVTYDTQTWPLKEARRRKNNPKPSGSGVELIDYMRNPLARDIDAECSGEYSITPYAVSEGPPALPSKDQVRSHCRFLSLGSVLTFDLPKDMSLIPSIQDIITIGPPESRRGEGTVLDPHTDRTTALSSFKQGRAPPSQKQSLPKQVVDTTETEAKTQTIILEMLPDTDEAFPPPPPPAINKDEDQTVPHDDLSDIQFSYSGIDSLHEETEQGWAKMVNELVHTRPADTACERQTSTPVNQHHCSSAVSVSQAPKCLSAHTLIKDLTAHQTWEISNTQRVQRVSPGMQLVQGSNQASHMVVNLKSNTVVAVREDSVDSGISSSGSFRLCTDLPPSRTPDDPQPRGVVGRMMSLEVGGLDGTKPSMSPAPAPASAPASAEADTIHPDHQQFEEEEEELEDIWNQTNGYRQSICSDIMYQPHQEEEEVSIPLCCPRETSSPKAQAVLYRKLVTTSAPNLLVAEFTLPSSIQSLLGYNKEQGPREELPPLGKKDRRSWAAFPHQDQPCKPSALVNETAADPVKLPDIEDQKRYIYQYREEEEEEEEEEVEEDTGCPKDQSMSLLSVLVGLDGTSQRTMHFHNQDNDTDEQGQGVATGGRSNIMNGSRPELQSMEGTLERKQKLQLAGKKASSRAWNSYHAVLYRQTLCFYQERKDTLRSSVCGLPLNLIGAECAPAPEYTKKPNCFRLRLRDGSEYLLSASSRFMMKKWMLKIQANTVGLCEPVTSMSSPSGIQELPTTSGSSLSSSCHCLAKCYCPARHDVTSSLPRRGPTGTARTKEIVVLTRESSHGTLCHPGRLGDLSPTSPSRAGRSELDSGSLRQTVTQRLCRSPRESSPSSPRPQVSGSHDWPSHKRRSHSFTSATYQKIVPVTLPPGGQGRDCSSSYSVTLLIGDKQTDIPSISKSTESTQLVGWQQDSYHDSSLRSYASLPRPRNKSVFKKFFGKKD